MLKNLVFEVTNQAMRYTYISLSWIFLDKQVTFGTKTLVFQGAKIWNALPVEIQAAQNLNIFINSIYIYIYIYIYEHSVS